MTSTSSPTRAEPRFDNGAVATVPDAASTVPTDRFSGVEETLAKLAHRAASDTRDARPRAVAAEKSADARIAPSSAAPTLGPATLGPADLSAQIPREPQSLGRLRTFANVAMVVCIGVAVIWAWRSYGEPVREVIAAFVPRSDTASAQSASDQPAVPQTPDAAPTLAPNAAPDPAPNPAPNPAPQQAATPPAVDTPPPAQTASIAPPAPPVASEPPAAAADHQQIDAMARDVAALRQTVEQLTAGQEQLKGEIAKLQAEKAAKPPPPKKRIVHHAPSAEHPADAFNPAQNPGAPGAPHTIGTVVERRAAPPYAAPPVLATPLAPPPELARRPPAPVPQP